MKKKVAILSEKKKAKENLENIFKNNKYLEFEVINRNRIKNFNKTKYYSYESNE
ncbi:hypothetical protein PL373_14400 [Tenacibaculum maritimum]|nr:hypothetical protein [Tenacibaculum maritimum]MDB0602309.1 hypothetical protein [Tenacibaculum maritimum]MDB0612445.1 hypothetical protein [Tenacibaculum maritimum]